MFTVLAPPSVGYYKLVINAARVPKVKAKVIMPVVATFLVSCKITKRYQYITFIDYLLSRVFAQLMGA